MSRTIVGRGGDVVTIALGTAEQCHGFKTSDGRRCMLKATHRIAGDVAPLRYCRTHARAQAALLHSTVEALA